MYTPPKYVVRHPNFEEYLKILPAPINIYYPDNEGYDAYHTSPHKWVRDLSEATKFDTVKDARGKFTSPLCALYAIENGVLYERFA